MTNKFIFKILNFLFLFFSIITCLGQIPDFIIPDSLGQSSSKEILDAYKKVYQDTLKSKIYLNTYLKKAIIEGDNKRKVLALNQLSYYEGEESKKIRLLDDAINITLNYGESNFKGYPESSYSYKGYYYISVGKYKNALNNFILGLKYAEASKDDKWIYIMKYNIAVIKLDIGKNKDALKLFKECYVYEKNRDLYSRSYNQSLLSLSEAYFKNEINDSSLVYIKEGIENTKNDYLDLHSKFLLHKGLYHLRQKDLKASMIYLDSFFRETRMSNSSNTKDLIFAYSELGEYFESENIKEKALENYIKLDSIIKISSIRTAEARKGYEYLVEYYKEDKDLNNQLKYIKKLLVFDSIYNSNRDIISDDLYDKFDTPQLLNEKLRIIDQLNEDKSFLNYGLYIFITSFLIIMIVLIFEYRKRKTYKIRYEQLTNKDKIEKVLEPDLKKNVPEDSGLKKGIIEDISIKLNQFENEQGYLDKTITLTGLSKKLGTNTRYLSKVINYTKEKNFSSYINDLRIEYVIEELKRNKTLRSYTIKGVAEDIGFKNTESFSTAFKKKTGLKPSYFIRSINLDENFSPDS